VNRKTLLMLLILPALPAFSKSSFFKVSLDMIIPIELSISQNLSFESTFTNKSSSMVTSPNSYRSAVFKASGEPNKKFIASIDASEIYMRLNGVGKAKEEIIVVSDFTFGGDLDKHGIGDFSNNGNLTNLRVGATASVKSYNMPGSYIGSTSLRLIYL